MSPLVESSSDSSNLELAVIIIYAILLVLILLLVLICLLIRRRALCFSKIRKHQNPDNNLHVEVQDLENNEEPEYEVCYNFIQNSILPRARLESQASIQYISQNNVTYDKILLKIYTCFHAT